MALFFQPGKRFSNELRVKQRNGAAYRRLLRMRKRQKPLPGTKTLLSGKNDAKLRKLFDSGKRIQDFQSRYSVDPPTNSYHEGCHQAAMVLSGLILMVLCAGVFFQLHGVFYFLAAASFIILHVLVLIGQFFGRGPNLKLLVCLFIAYGGFILWGALSSLKWLLF